MTVPRPAFSLARAGTTGFAGAAFSAVAGFGLTLLLTRGLGAHGAGFVLQVMASVSIALAFTKLGMDSASLWLAPRMLLSDPRGLRGVIAFALLVAAGGGILASAVFWTLPIVTGEQGALSATLTAAGWWLPAGSVLAVALSALRGLGHTTSYVLLGNVVQPATRLAAVAAIMAVGGGALSSAIGWSAVPAAVLIPVLVVLHRSLRQAERDGVAAWIAPPKTRGLMWRYALPRTLSAGLEQGLLWLDVLIVGAIAGTTVAGLYGGASRLIAAGLVIDTALRLVVAPRFSELLHRGDTAGVQDLYRSTTRGLILFATPVYLLLGFFAPLALSVLGSEFVSAAPALVVLCVGAIVALCAGPVHSLLLMSGRSALAAGNKAVVLAVNVVGDILLVPSLGIMGAAISWSVSMVADAGLATIETRRLMGLRLDLASVLRPLALAVGCAGLPSAVATIFGGGWLAAALATVATAALLAAVLRAQRQSRERHRIPTTEEDA